MCAPTFAQDFTWGIRAGLNVSSLNNKYTGPVEEGESASDYEYDFKSKVGFNAGIMIDYAFSKHFSLESGLYFTQLGGKDKSSEEEYTETTTINQYYLQLPVLATYNLPFGKKSKWSVQAGPYVSCGIGGKTKYEFSGDGEDFSAKINSFGNKGPEIDDETMEMKGDSGLKRFDVGLAFATGVTLNRCYVGVKYNLGLSNILHKDVTKEGGAMQDMKLKNGCFSVNVGFNF